MDLYYHRNADRRCRSLFLDLEAMPLRDREFPSLSDRSTEVKETNRYSLFLSQKNCEGNVLLNEGFLIAL